jgi:hypothetical protein
MHAGLLAHPALQLGRPGQQQHRSLWQQLYAAHADLVLDGHDHIYERFAPQTPTGVADPVNGIREITVGTGGANHTSPQRRSPPTVS